MKELFTVLPPAEAWSRLEKRLPCLEQGERVPLAQALDRVLAVDLHSPEDLPAFARSTMDGYAVRARDTFGATEGMPAYLTVAGEVLMGQSAADIALGPGQAARIATGGMLPPAADAVVMVEHTQTVDGRLLEVTRPVAPGENVLAVGEDIGHGAAVLPRGHRLRPQDLGGLAALGFTSVQVARRLRVALLASGDEVVPPEARPAPGQVRDVNTSTLAALVQREGHEPIALGIVRDDYAALQAAARHALEIADVLVLSAGSSVSTRDMTAEVLASLGEPGVLVHGVALRPGKPTVLGLAGQVPLFGLPGNPVSCMVTFDLFVAPALARLSGAQAPARKAVRARLALNVPSAPGREDYVQVRLEERDGESWAVPVFGKSNLIYSLIRADGLIKVHLDANGLPAGEPVSVILF